MVSTSVPSRSNRTAIGATWWRGAEAVFLVVFITYSFLARHILLARGVCVKSAAWYLLVCRAMKSRILLIASLVACASPGIRKFDDRPVAWNEHDDTSLRGTPAKSSHPRLQKY